MATLTNDEIIEALKEKSLIEISELVKQFEEVFGVSAAGGEAAAGAEQDEFDVILEAAGDKKIQVIKVVRELTSLGLKEAKDLVDGAPKPVLEKANKETADKAKESLEGAGATVTVK
jgi:large subunit ribosomal protein L7/L12